MLNRSEATDTSSYEKYLELIESIKLTYTAPSSLPFSSNSLKLLVDLDGDGTTFEQQTLSLTKGGTFEISDIGGLLQTYPLEPALKVVVDSGDTLSLTNDTSISTNLKLTIAASGTIDVWEAQ